MSKITQLDMVVIYLNTHGSISDEQAKIDLGIKRLSAIITNLRKAGWVFVHPTPNIAAKNELPNANYVPTYNPTSQENLSVALVDKILEENYIGESKADNAHTLLVDYLRWCRANGLDYVQIGGTAQAAIKP